MTTNSKRRWFQFSLRGLLVGIIVLCVMVGGYLMYVQQRLAQQKATVQAIVKNGGTIRWDDTPLDRTLAQRLVLGDDTPEGVYYNSTAVFTDSDLLLLRSLPKLRILDLSDTQVTDSHLAQIAGLKKLESLRLDNTHVTDTGLNYLAEMTNLRELRLTGTRVTDSGVQRLKAALPELEIIRNELP